jgi:hypothetical protein
MAAMFPCSLAEWDPWYKLEEQAWFKTEEGNFFPDSGNLLMAVLPYLICCPYIYQAVP